MRRDYANGTDRVKGGMGAAIDWILNHTKIVMPVVLVICVSATVLLAVNANHKEQIEQEAEITAATADSAQAEDINAAKFSIPNLPLEENAYPEVNSVVKEYYQALADGDIETIFKYNKYLSEDEIARIRIEEVAKYIESYEAIDVYTKMGMTDGSYVAYVCSEVKFTDVEQLFPGYQVYYISKEDDGSYSMNDGAYDSEVYDYVINVSFQDDVVELNNKVTVAYNELVDSDKDIQEFVAYLNEKIPESVGETLAHAAKANEEAIEVASIESNTSETQEIIEDIETAIITVRATDVVNIRSSDSETADKIDKAQIGQEFKLLEEKGNGWSKVEYNQSDAYIKSEYLEVASKEITSQEVQAVQETPQETETAQNVTTSGIVTVKESVRVRAKASTDAEVLGTVYAGTELDSIETQSGGWTKVKYNNKVGYIKSEYLE